METWQNGPVEVAQNDHHAKNEDALTSPETSRGRQHSQHSQHLQNAINYLQKYVHSTRTNGDNVNVGLETIDEDPGPGNTINRGGQVHVKTVSHLCHRLEIPKPIQSLKKVGNL